MPEYRKYFIAKPEFVIDSVKKFYKSDSYRNFLTSFLLAIKPEDTDFVNCVDYSEEDTTGWH